MSAVSSCRQLAQLSLVTPVNHVVVLNAYECPNFRCTVHAPHTFQYPVPVHPPRSIHYVILRRFSNENNPFPRRNRWEIVEQPTVWLRQGCRVYLKMYGVITLIDLDGDRVPGWKVFRCVDEDGLVLTEVVAREEWCQMKEGPLQVTWSSIRSFFSILC